MNLCVFVLVEFGCLFKGSKALCVFLRRGKRLLMTEVMTNDVNEIFDMRVLCDVLLNQVAWWQYDSNTCFLVVRSLLRIMSIV